MSPEQLSVRIAENTNISEARRACLRFAQVVNFDETAEGCLAIVVTELARNVLLHGGGGEIVLQAAGGGDAGRVDVLALDKGPGIANVSRALQDGYSSAGTPGTGFGAIRRLSSSFDIYTQPGAGTAVLARVKCAQSADEEASAIVGSVCVPIVGETRCGDAWEYQDQAGRRLLLLADGLGHGPSASDAAQEALAAFRANLHKGPKDILQAAHKRLQKTRGAAVAAAEIDFEHKIVRYSGIGNIASAIVANGKSRSMISHNGIVGHQSERPQEFTFPWERDALLIMHSDGLTTKWNLDRYPGLQGKPALLVAGVLYRDFKRGRDDATVVVSRETRAA